MPEQASLESKFGKQDTPNSDKYILTEPLRRCKSCKEFKPKADFRIIKGYPIRTCKKCENIASSEYGHNHRDLTREAVKRWRDKHSKEVKQHSKEYTFLFSTGSTRGRIRKGFFDGQGICLICGNLHPLELVNHHIIPDDDTIFSLCGSCHRKYHTNNRNKHMISVLNALENSKLLWDSDGQPKGLKPVPMWTADLSLKGAIEILKSYDLPGYEPVGIEV